MQKARRHSSTLLRPLVSARFQVLLHSAVRGSFHLSLTVLVHYRSLSSIQPWRMVPPDSDRISLVPPYSGYSYVVTQFQIHDFHVLRSNFPEDSSIKLQSMLLSYNPGHAVTPPVWALPRSLATTCGITVVFSSCRYLDVSVPCVCPIIMVVCLQHTGFPHSEISGSKAICASPELIAACHVLHRRLMPRHSPCALSNLTYSFNSASLLI